MLSWKVFSLAKSECLNCIWVKMCCLASYWVSLSPSKGNGCFFIIAICLIFNGLFVPLSQAFNEILLLVKKKILEKPFTIVL